MEKLNELKNKIIDELETLNANEGVIQAVANAGSEAEIQNIVADWQRSEDYAQKAPMYEDAGETTPSAIPQGYVNEDPAEKIRSSFAGMPRTSMRPALALYNNANGTNFTERQVDSILSTPRDFGREKVDDFVNTYRNERRVQDSVQDVLDYQNSWLGRAIKPMAQTIDGVAGFVPNPAGYGVAAIGPMMRAYDQYRQGQNVDPYAVSQDIAMNEMGQSIGGKVLKYGANLAQRLPFVNRFAPQMVRASQAKRMDNASFMNPIMAANRRLEQLSAAKAGKSIEEQQAINQEIVKIAEWARQVGVRETQPIYERALEMAKTYSRGNEGGFVRPFSTTEKALAAVDDGMTKYGLKKVPDAIGGLFNGEQDESPLEKAKKNTRKAEIPLLKYLIKLDSLVRLGYQNSEAEYNNVSRLLGLDSLSPNDRLRYAKEAVQQDSLVDDWRTSYSR